MRTAQAGSRRRSRPRVVACRPPGPRRRRPPRARARPRARLPPRPPPSRLPPPAAGPPPSTAPTPASAPPREASPTSEASPTLTPAPPPADSSIPDPADAVDPGPADTSAPTPPADSSIPAGPATPSTALETVAELEIKGRAPRTGYDRDAFAYREYDQDRNGCDVRNDILRRDLVDVDIRPNTNGCVVESGTVHDPYSGEAIDFVRGVGTSNAVQIDHVVALSDAWQKGAQAWDEATMREFGNDPLNLLAVDGPLNSQKGDGDTATWLPPNRGFRCAYVARQVAVKHEYELWVTQAEHDAMVRVLSTCPDEPLPERETAPLMP